MEDSEFNRRAEEALQEIEVMLEQSGADLDFELQPGGVLEIECADGSKIIVNRHAIAKEIWVAARSGGFHFRWQGGQWRDTRDGEELFAKLQSLIGVQSTD